MAKPQMDALERLQAWLDCTPLSMVCLDRDGVITHANAAWRSLGRGDGVTLEVGQVYLAVWDALNDAAVAAKQGIAAVIAGNLNSFETSYACHSPVQLQWFRLHAQELAVRGGAIVVFHTNITAQHAAEARLRVQAAVAAAISLRAPLPEMCFQLGRAISSEFSWDFVGVWRLEPLAWSLRCVTSWIRPGLGLEPYQEASLNVRLSPDGGLPGRAWTSRAVSWVTAQDQVQRDPPQEPWTIMPPAAAAAGLRSGLAIPIRCNDDVLAVIELGSSRDQPCDPALAALLEEVGISIALSELRNRAEAHAERAREELALARDHFEAVLECAPVLIAAFDRSGKILFVNRSTRGHTKEDLIGTPWRDYVPEAQHPRLEQALLGVYETGASQFHDVGIPGPDGKPRHFAIFLGPMRSGGKVTAAVAVSQEVTAAKLAQAELGDTRRLAAVGALAAGVAHEINTPVQFISDSVYFLRDALAEILAVFDQLELVRDGVTNGAGPVELRAAAALTVTATEEADLPYLRENLPKAFDRCINGLERIAGIVRSIKEFAQPGEKEMRPADLNHAIQTTLAVAGNEYRDVADIETELGNLPPVMCHVNDINQVILSILVNAAHAISDVVKGSDRRGTIRIRTREDEGSAVISVTDTGCGIPEFARERIFEPFFTTKEVGRGTGQGLSIARTIVKDKHGGSLSFETESGKGTTFTIRLPIARKAQ